MKITNSKVIKKLTVFVAPLAFAVIGYLILYFSAKSFITPVISIWRMLYNDSGETAVSDNYSDIYTDVFHNYTDSVPSSQITFPLPNTKFGEISIEGTAVSCALIYGDSDAMLHRGACQYAGSSFPGFGSTVLIAGHNNTYFNSLKDAVPGAIITIKTNYGVYKYRITSSAIKSNDDKSAYDLSSKSENVVLYTCYPFNALGLTSQRYFVYGEYVSGPRVLLDE